MAVPAAGRLNGAVDRIGPSFAGTGNFDPISGIVSLAARLQAQAKAMGTETPLRRPATSFLPNRKRQSSPIEIALGSIATL
jgi:hypothetical protein